MNPTTIASLPARKLGKLDARHDNRTLRLERYLGPGLLPAPPAISWATPIGSWAMMANDRLGDCGLAAAGHLIQEWTTDESSPFTPSDDQIISAYSAVSGYDPLTGENDNGVVLLDALNYWRQTGVAGRKIQAFASIPPSASEMIKQSVLLFGGAYIGLQLPISAQNKDVWTVNHGSWLGNLFHYNLDDEPGSWGGHCVPIVAYDTNFLYVVTWGAILKMTWAFFAKYCDEAYAVLSPDWYSSKGVTPSGLDAKQLIADLALITA